VPLTRTAAVQARPRPRTNDVVVLVPGIMGSRLVDAATGETVWGADPKALVGLVAELSGGSSSVGRLAPTDEELAGAPGRLRPDGLLTSPW
jgi:hypothetical protein